MVCWGLNFIIHEVRDEIAKLESQEEELSKTGNNLSALPGGDGIMNMFAELKSEILQHAKDLEIWYKKLQSRIMDCGVRADTTAVALSSAVHSEAYLEWLSQLHALRPFCSMPKFPVQPDTLQKILVEAEKVQELAGKVSLQGEPNEHNSGHLDATLSLCKSCVAHPKEPLLDMAYSLAASWSDQAVKQIAELTPEKLPLPIDGELRRKFELWCCTVRTLESTMAEYEDIRKASHEIWMRVLLPSL